MPKSQSKEEFNNIVRFSGIKKFIDSPLHTYSTGMKLRLGFSVAAYSDPDILVIDEIFSAGDEKFRKKSYQKMQEFFRRKKTILFVSHNLEIIQKLCSKTLWLDKGRVKLLGSSKKVTSLYRKS